MSSTQAQRQDSVTGRGGRNKFWGAREVYLCEFERGTGARKIYSSLDQTNKVGLRPPPKKNKGLQFKFFSGYSGYRLKILAIFHEFLGEDKKKKKVFCPKHVTKSGVSPKKLRKSGWQTPIWVSICTPEAPSLLISSGHSPRLGHNFRLGGTSSH